MEIREPAFFYALDVARAFVDDNGSDDPDSIVNAAMLVGSHLASRDCPGRWACFDAASFFERLGGDDRTRLGIAIQVMALFQWLGLIDAIDIDRAAMISAAIREHGPRSAILDDFNAAFGSHVVALR